MIPLLVVLPVTVEGNREEMCEPRHTSLLVQKMQGRAEVSRLADANSPGMQRPTSAYEPGSSSLDLLLLLGGLDLLGVLAIVRQP